MLLSNYEKTKIIHRKYVVRGAFKSKNVTNCGKSPKGGGTDIGEIYATFGSYMAYI